MEAKLRGSDRTYGLCHSTWENQRLVYVVGSQNVLVYVTVNGTIVGWDLRAPGNIWTLKDDPKRGR